MSGEVDYQTKPGSRSTRIMSPTAAVDDGPMATVGRGSRAGLYAEERYRRGRQSWRRSTRRPLAITCAPFIAAGLVVLVVDRHLLSWAGGALFGAFIAIWIVIRETPPRYVEKWQAGAEGERKTARALRRLERKGWTVRHDIQRRYGNYDHIAVGPSGVYMLETKNLEGVVEIRKGVPHLNRRHDPDAIEPFTRMRSTALGAAAAIKKDIEHRCGACTWVQAVVVFWSEFPEQLTEYDRCVYIHGSRLRDWLRTRPARLEADQLARIAGALDELAVQSADAEER